MACIFCQIIARELPAEILFEDKDLVVFKDINPEAPIHLLIVPKKHFDSLNSLDEKTAQIGAQMFLTAKKMAESHVKSEHVLNLRGDGAAVRPW